MTCRSGEPVSVVGWATMPGALAALRGIETLLMHKSGLFQPSLTGCIDGIEGYLNMVND